MVRTRSKRIVRSWGVHSTVVKTYRKLSKVEFTFKIQVKTGKISTTFDRIFDFYKLLQSVHPKAEKELLQLKGQGVTPKIQFPQSINFTHLWIPYIRDFPLKIHIFLPFSRFFFLKLKIVGLLNLVVTTPQELAHYLL